LAPIPTLLHKQSRRCPKSTLQAQPQPCMPTNSTASRQKPCSPTGDQPCTSTRSDRLWATCFHTYMRMHMHHVHPACKSPVVSSQVVFGARALYRCASSVLMQQRVRLTSAASACTLESLMLAAATHMHQFMHRTTRCNIHRDCTQCFMRDMRHWCMRM